MILVKNAFTSKFSTVLIIISILHACNGHSVEYPDVDVPESVESSAASSSFDYSENAIEDDDDYPSEILEEIVKKTYTLLKSDDNEGKRKLKIRPSHYSYYLHTPRIAEPAANRFSKTKSGKRIRHFQEGCSAKNTLAKPKRRPDDSGTNYTIVNVDNFKQYVNVSKCVEGAHSCGNPLTGSYLYESKCEQIRERVGLISIPVGKELVKENQEIQYFSFPTKCICKSKRIRKSENKKKESRSLGSISKIYSM